MPRVSQHLWFEAGMEQAVSLYTSLIPGSSMGPVQTLSADTPSGPQGSVHMVSFTLAGQQYRALQAGPLDPFNHSFSIVVECADQSEIDRLWDALRQGGTVERCGWLRDRWGLSWQIVPAELGTLLGSPDQARARRATQAMLAMVKFDIAGLRRAADGEGG